MSNSFLTLYEWSRFGRTSLFQNELYYEIYIKFEKNRLEKKDQEKNYDLANDSL